MNIARSLDECRRCVVHTGVLLIAILVSIGPAQAESVPPHLASLSAELFRSGASTLEDQQLDAEHREAGRRALDLFRRSGVRNWARDSVEIPGAALTAAEALSFDLAHEADRTEFNRILSLDSEVATDAIASRMKSAGADEAAINDAVNAFETARATTAALPTRHEIALDPGELVTIEWNPQEGTVTLRASDDGSTSGKPFDSALIGDTALEIDPATGGLRASVKLADVPARILSAADIERIRASILGEWKDRSGDVWLFESARGDSSAGLIRRSLEAIDIEITKLTARIDEIERAKEFIWRDLATGEIIRQQRFRRLDAPWEFVGEESLIENAKEEVARHKLTIAELEAEKSGSGLDPVHQYDPAGYEQAARTTGARPISVWVTRARDAYTYHWAEALFDGRRVTMRRTFHDIRDYNESLPGPVMSQLITRWSPPSWAEVEATIDPATGLITLSGNIWGLLVTYSGGGLTSSAYRVESIHTPYSRSVFMTRKGVEIHVADGASSQQIP
ncbi:MAG: hypothetical protein WD711_10280 [Dongiaceae bacterium]